MQLNKLIKLIAEKRKEFFDAQQEYSVTRNIDTLTKMVALRDELVELELKLENYHDGPSSEQSQEN